MKSVRTSLYHHDVSMFRLFLDTVGLKEIMIGEYENIDERWYKSKHICYAYSEKSDETVATLSCIMLKYGSLENAYKTYTNQHYGKLTGELKLTS